MAKQVVWQYAYAPGVWCDMADEVAAQVEEAFLNDDDKTILQLPGWPGQPLFIDFQAMVQKVDIERRIRRICILAD